MTLNWGVQERDTLLHLSHFSHELLPDGFIGDMCWIVDERSEH
jgi:hypothetical protein